MGGCCQTGSGKNEFYIEDDQVSNYMQDNPSKFKAGINQNFSISNNKSFLDFNDNTSRQSFLKSSINVLETNKETIEMVPEIYKPLLKEKSLVINFPACLDEVIVPVWITKNTKITFHVVGMWNIFENDSSFDCNGIKNIGDEVTTPFNFPIGSLCGYIQGGDVFQISNEFALESQISGPLVLFQNNGDYDVKPNGNLVIIIEGGIKQPIEEIEMRLGWSSELIEEINQITFMSDEEKTILYYLNKLRVNPPLFAKLYLSHRVWKSQSDEECYNYLFNITPIAPLKASIDLYKSASLHAQDMALSNMTGHISSNGLNLKERLEDLKIDINKIGENCSYGISNPLAIVLELLVDETDSKGHRRNLLDAQFTLIGIALQKHPYWAISCVQDFSKLP